eukprot:TRINITY_DN2034_c0_g1_i1.p1 TRINITY_DN2034_c0_g1~~TRINITY_DN2034_c0_g1_i1.p1  ORF type:complete len:470 (+),score=111.90 TRINITY_DN2034_c0_g1_i1:182-1591(+)
MATLHHAALRMLGKEVDIQLVTGAVWRGALAHVDAKDKFGLTLKQAYLIQEATSESSLPFTQAVPPRTPDKVTARMVVRGEDLAQLHAVGVDLSARAPPPSRTTTGASLDRFTDTGISGGVGPTHERELQPFDFSDGPAMSLEDDPSSGSGWSAEAMLREHEKRTGTTSDFNDDTYSTKLNTSHPEHAARMRKAEKLAQSMTRNARVAPEDRVAPNGDEEAQFSSVVRASSKPARSTTADFLEFSQRVSTEAPPGLGENSADNSGRAKPGKPAMGMEELEAELSATQDSKPAAGGQDGKPAVDATAAGATDQEADKSNAADEPDKADKADKADTDKPAAAPKTEHKWNLNAAEFKPSSMAPITATPPQPVLHPHQPAGMQPMMGPGFVSYQQGYPPAMAYGPGPGVPMAMGGMPPQGMGYHANMQPGPPMAQMHHQPHMTGYPQAQVPHGYAPQYAQYHQGMAPHSSGR